jgi:ABC-type uncharacterized transport system permease subunit
MGKAPPGPSLAPDGRLRSPRAARRMEPIAIIVFYLGVVAYSVAATLFFVDLARPGGERVVRWAPRALGAGVTAHGIHLVANVVRGTAGLGTLPFALSASALITALAYLAMRQRARLDALGAVVSPIALTLLVGAQFVQPVQEVTSIPRTLIAMHVLANLLGLGLFLLAGTAGAFYLVQERRLKEKRVRAPHGRLPALDSLDSTEHRLLLAGFPLLTFGIVTGAVFTAQLEHMSGAAAARAGLGYATWVLVAGVLVLRALAGWRGRRAAYGTLAGVLCVLLVIGFYIAQSAGGAS